MVLEDLLLWNREFEIWKLLGWDGGGGIWNLVFGIWIIRVWVLGGGIWNLDF